MSSVKRISPMLAVADMNQTIEFYRELLGFSVVTESAQYSVIERNGATIHLMLASDSSVLDAVRGHTDIDIEVEGIDELWSSVQNYQGEYQMRELFDQPYGMREFHVNDPNGCLVFVGERM